MKKIMVAASLVVLLGGAAVAQTGGSKGATSGGASSGSVLPAPVGHRQPRAADVPSEKNVSDPNDPLSKENQALDKKIKSICRGC
ncbi:MULTISPECIES: hypothetical protein [Bradyrhizobium]|uniref:hypothetical protein n=1 Tax=Bradyrhizobium TaxID=374 RepID=UPI001BA77737|nr:MULTISPECIES: hypothetical protein [Bradyrhizobium]MBR0813034.1 hypothetical protein [Bradyrhizobium diazoefficiens]WOH70705.1 hypothetical protein RX330_20635 [Bradyrhizobium sp. NDS-1]